MILYIITYILLSRKIFLKDIVFFVKITEKKHCIVKNYLENVNNPWYNIKQDIGESAFFPSHPAQPKKPPF